MNIPITMGWVWAILPGSREWALLALVALVLFGRSPGLRRRVARWGRPWRDGGKDERKGYDNLTLILVAVVSAAFAAWLATWMTLGQRLPP